MWKKIYCAALVCLMCMMFTAVAVAQAEDVARTAEKPERIELVLVLDKSGYCTKHKLFSKKAEDKEASEREAN